MVTIIVITDAIAIIATTTITNTIITSTTLHYHTCH
jgi:hypothetical protein